MQNTTALLKNPARKVFAPMFKARWQNMQNIITDSVYIERIPTAYKTYYQAYIQQWLAWSRGFVPMLHQKEFFSTGIGYSICELLTIMCMSGGYRVTADDKNAEAQAFMQSWCDEDFNNVLNKMFFDANAGGNVLLMLTPVNGELYPSVIPINRCVFQIGRTGRVSSAMILNRFISGSTAYYTREMRVEQDGKAFWKVDVAEGTLVTTPTWGQLWLKSIPECIKEQWDFSYGDIEPSVWYEMPEKMRGIGVYNVKNKAVAAAIADMPGYSDSTLHTCLDILYSIDYNYTAGQVDLYMGKSRCLVPKQMGTRVVPGTVGTLSEGLNFAEAVSVETAPLDEDFYTQVGDQTVDGKPITPTFIQPDFREVAHKFIRDADIELLAGKIGISASTLASHLAGGGTKTDDQINMETSMDEKTVGNKRGLANRALNSMLSDVAHFYGFESKISVLWGRSTSNSAKENDDLLRNYQAGTLTLREYLRLRWSERSEEEIEKLAQEIEEEREKNTAFDFGISDDGGEYGEFSGQPTKRTSVDG